jgi:hypothetical protein
MALDLPEGGRAPVVEFRDVRLSDPDGAPRAAFPAVRVHLDAGPILSGQFRPSAWRSPARACACRATAAGASTSTSPAPRPPP